MSFLGHKTVNLLYIHQKDGPLRFVQKRDGIYKTTTGILIDPQPKDEEIVHMRRHYADSASSRNFKRQVTYVHAVGDVQYEFLKSKAIVDYCGEQPKSKNHGNAKTLNRAFERSDPKVLEKIRKMRGEGMSSQNIYQNLVAKDPLGGPRDLKTVQNTVFLMVDPTQHWSNAAEEVKELYGEYYRGQTEGGGYIRHIRHAGKSPPAFIIYSDHCMQDIKQFCGANSEHRSVLGADRTFTLSRCFVTVLVYKNMNLEWKGGKRGNPVFVGPVYLHWKGDFANYYELFSALKRDLFDFELAGTQLDPTFLNFGTDQEKAMVKAITAVFPKSPKLLCTLHLKKNILAYLKDKLGLAQIEREKMARRILGLRRSESLEEYDSKRSLLGAELQAEYPQFERYYTDFTEALRSYCVIPKMDGHHDSVDWTNNATESINSLLRLKTHFAPQALPGLAKTIKRIQAAQELEVRRALFKTGEYQLAPHMEKLAVDRAVWAAMEEKEQEALVEKFYKGPRKQKKKTVASQDGLFEIPGK